MIPICRGSGPAPTWSASPSSGRRSSATGLFLTEEEFQAREKQAQRQAEVDVLDFDLQKPPDEIVALGDVGGVTSPPPHWLERGLPSRQSSLIVDPPDGKMPPMTPEGKARQTNAGGTYVKQTGFKSADELGPYDRCISRGLVGSMMPVVYNNGNEIIQAPGLVAFRNEMIHETRIIPLDDRPCRQRNIKSWMGTSRGHFEGNTLVVATTNLNGKTGMQGNGMMLIPSDAIEITERFTPLSANILQYEVTSTTRRPGPAVEGLVPAAPRQQYQMFEYACHEGNYAMRNTLSGFARRREDAGALRLSMVLRSSSVVQAVVLAVLVSAGVVAQETEFEVVFIKLNTEARPPFNAVDRTFMRLTASGASNGRYTMRGFGAPTVSVLIQAAHQVKEFQVVGAPGWVDIERYDVDARAPGATTFEQMRPMLQSLLARRFQLEFHRESRPLPVYELVPARNGLKITPMKEGSCVPLEQAKPFAPLNICGGTGRQSSPAPSDGTSSKPSAFRWRR